MASIDAMQARMLADLGIDRRNNISEIDADLHGRRIDAATSRAKDLKAQHIGREREQRLESIERTHPDGAIIKAWNAQSLNNDQDTDALHDRYAGYAHRAGAVFAEDKEFQANANKYSDERAIYMAQRRSTGPQDRRHFAAGTITASGHRRAVSPRSQGTARFVDGKKTVHGQNKVSRNVISSPARPQQVSAKMKAAKTPAVMLDGPIASRTRSKQSPTPSHTPRPPVQSQMRIFTTNKAVKSGPLPSEMQTGLRVKVKMAKSEKLQDYIRFEPRMDQPAEDIDITNAWQDFTKAESTKIQSAISTTMSSASVYMPPLHISKAKAGSDQASKTANNDLAAAQHLTISQLQKMCQDIDRARLLECIGFLFDINRQTWLEENTELLDHFKYTGARLRREMMVIAQLPLEHPRTKHFFQEFGFMLQIEEHISAARLALDTVQCEDQASKEWFEANDQYLPFYKMALWIADNKPIEDYKADTDAVILANKKLLDPPIVEKLSTADEIPQSSATKFSSLYSSRFATSQPTLVNAASSAASSTDENTATPRYTLSSRMTAENQTEVSTESSIVNMHKPLAAVAAATTVSATTASCAQIQTPRETLQVQENNGKRMQQVFDGKAMYRENGIWMFCQ